MPVRSTQLWAAGITSGGVDQLLYQVPVAKRTILKSWAVFNNSGAAVTITQWICQSGLQVVEVLAANNTIADDDHAAFEGFIVLNVGDVVTINSPYAGGDVKVAGFGAELLLP